MRRHLTPAKLLIAGLALTAAVVAVLFLVPADDTFLFLPDEPHAVEPLIEVDDRKPPPADGGGIFFVDVLVRRPTLIERLLPGVFHDGASVVPEHAINPTGLSDEARRRASLQVMDRSQRIAAAVAFREAGHDVTARPTGAFVAQVLPGSPAAGRLHPSDVIEEVDGERIRTLAGLRRVLFRKRAGETVELAIRRRGETERVRLRLAPSPDDPTRGVIGVLVEQAVDIRLPVEVKIEAGNVGGPSAGLAFALGLLEELGRDVDHGRRVAVTGEIRLDGGVGAVGGIRQKTIGARESGVDAFVVPAGENAEEARRYADGLRIVPVKTFQQALQALATIPQSAQD